MREPQLTFPPRQLEDFLQQKREATERGAKEVEALAVRERRGSLRARTHTHTRAHTHTAPSGVGSVTGARCA